MARDYDCENEHDYEHYNEYKKARLSGLEPETPGLGILCSIHLSYRRGLLLMILIFAGKIKLE